MGDLPSILGGISADHFLNEYWQKKPLLIRRAIPNFDSPISGEELAGLSLEKDIESRLIFEKGGKKPWELKLGPFEENIFQNLPERYWTLLVQAVDLWVPNVKKLTNYFCFLPSWRLDDIMVSYAPEGGSVGPHFDNYDVFLLQGLGQKKWKLGQKYDSTTPILNNNLLSIVEDFKKNQEWVLGPGDMLYVPPKLAHWGIACSNSLTYSVGFRSPSIEEMLGDLTAILMKKNHSNFYTDPPLKANMAKTSIDPSFIQQVKKMLEELMKDDELLNDWFAKYMTTPKFPDLSKELNEQRIAKVAGISYINGKKKAAQTR